MFPLSSEYSHLFLNCLLFKSFIWNTFASQAEIREFNDRVIQIQQLSQRIKEGSSPWGSVLGHKEQQASGEVGEKAQCILPSAGENSLCDNNIANVRIMEKKREEKRPTLGKPTLWAQYTFEQVVG